MPRIVNPTGEGAAGTNVDSETVKRRLGVTVVVGAVAPPGLPGAEVVVGATVVADRIAASTEPGSPAVSADWEAIHTKGDPNISNAPKTPSINQRLR